MTSQPMPRNAEHYHGAPHLSLRRTPRTARAAGTGAQVARLADALDGDRCWLVLAGRVGVATPVVGGRPGAAAVRGRSGIPVFALDGAAPTDAASSPSVRPAHAARVRQSDVRTLSATRSTALIVNQDVGRGCVRSASRDVSPTHAPSWRRTTRESAGRDRCHCTGGGVGDACREVILHGDPRSGERPRLYRSRDACNQREPAQILLVSVTRSPISVSCGRTQRLHQLVLKCIEQMNMRAETSLRDRLPKGVVRLQHCARRGRLVATVPSEGGTGARSARRRRRTRHGINSHRRARRRVRWSMTRSTSRFSPPERRSAGAGTSPSCAHRSGPEGHAARPVVGHDRPIARRPVDAAGAVAPSQ